MADNVQANAGSGGAIFKTDEIASVHTPLTVGDYCYRFEASGAVVAASQEKFKVIGKC